MRFTLEVRQTNNMMKGKSNSFEGITLLLTWCVRIDGSYLPWSIEFRKLLLDKYPLPEDVNPIPSEVLLQPKWKLRIVEVEDGEEYKEASLDTDIEDSTVKDLQNSVQIPPNPLPSSHTVTVNKDVLSLPESIPAIITKNERLTPLTHWQDVRHLVFELPVDLDYGPGDVLIVQPKNFPEDVDQIISLMDWTRDADRSLEFVPTSPFSDAFDSPPPIRNLPTNTTLRTLLTNYLDFTSIPRRSFFSLIAHFTHDQFHKDRLLEFINPEFIDELYDYTTRPRRSILEVLQEFESVKIPWQWVASVIPVLRGRQFSIASAGGLKYQRTTTNMTLEGTQKLEGPQSRVDLLVAIVKYRTVIKKIRQGVCTRYLASLSPGTKLDILFQKGSLIISRTDASKPVMMVGPGTGVAPMRSLIWHRLAIHLAEKRKDSNSNTSELPTGDSLLFYGCRSEQMDYFFKEEWEYLSNVMPLTITPAFSRDQREKIYVQDLIRTHAAQVFDLLHENNGTLFICGSSGKMPAAVREAIIFVFEKAGSMERDMAEAELGKMEKQGRYLQETW
jgi:sulfite reductase alpha subunit-like flavoprotein